MERAIRSRRRLSRAIEKKTWDEMSDDEKRAFDKDFIRKLKQAIAALS